MEQPAVALVGAGQMGGALVRGWLAAIRRGGGLTLTVIEPNFDPALERELDAAGAVLNPKDEAAADVVVLALKPQAFADVAAGAKSFIGPHTLVLSVMAGVTMATISRALETERVIRAMPNTPGQIGQGITAYVASSACGADDRELAEQLLEPLGSVESIPNERLMDVVTAVSGSGPAYVFLLAEAMAAAGERIGLPSDIAAILARKTIEGAGALLASSTTPPGDLRRSVTSPGGTTEAALDVLQSGEGLGPVMRRAVSAATQRSRELGRGVDTP